jgi:hypothetical protein
MAENKIEKICNQYLSSAAPTFSKLADFYISNRTCYSTVPSPVDEKRDGKWHYSTCPNCKNARVNQTNKKKKDGVKRKEPEDSSHVSSSSQGDALRQTQQQQQQQIQQLASVPLRAASAAAATTAAARPTAPCVRGPSTQIASSTSWWKTAERKEN